MIEILLFIAFLLRMFAINQGLWLDEAIGAIATRDFSYTGIVQQFLTHDNHPPLYYLILKVWTDLVGHSDVALRAPNVFFGVIVVLLTWKITSKHAPKIAFLSTLFVASSPFLIYYSHEVRMYMLTVLFTLSLSLSFLSTIANPKKRMPWIVFSLSLVGLLFTDYVPIFFLPVLPLYARAMKVKKVWWRNAFVSFVPLALLGVLWLPTLLTQVAGGAEVLRFLPEWRNLAGGANFKELALVWMKFILGRISLQPKSVYYLLVGVFSMPFMYALWKSFKSADRFIVFVRMWFFVPLILCFVASLFFPAFVYFRLTFIVPAFFILIADGIGKIKHDGLSICVTAMIVLSAAVGLYNYTTDYRQQREQWREAVSFVEHDAVEGDIALFEFPDSFAPYRWYQTNKLPGVGALSEISAESGRDRESIREKIRNVQSVYYFEYLRDLTDPDRIVESVLTEEGFHVDRENSDFYGVGTIHIWKR